MDGLGETEYSTRRGVKKKGRRRRKQQRHTYTRDAKADQDGQDRVTDCGKEDDDDDDADSLDLLLTNDN